jgi:predicted RNA binding protein YcfA (HicA-like mRNA interferase family)
MSQFPSVTGKNMVKALGKVGFAVVRVKGSHHRLEHSDGRKTTVPVHGKETLGPGLINKILHDVDLNRDQLRELL